MYIIATLFSGKEKSHNLRLKGESLKNFLSAYPEMAEYFQKVKNVLGFFAGEKNADEKAVSFKLSGYDIKENEISIRLEKQKETDLKSADVGESLRSLCKMNGICKDTLPPLVCFVSQRECEGLCECARRLANMEAMSKAGDYRSAAGIFEPLGEVRNNIFFWNNVQILYLLGVACSKLSVTLKVRSCEAEKLKDAKRYRDFCVQFLERGALIEQGARCATALAYRYYSDVHELTRPGERRDQNLEDQLEKANEWLTRALEINPQSIKNNYRKGKLIIEKQAPYLLFGKRSFGEEEARLLREIREVGEEHLANAISIYESLDDAEAKEYNRREYAKALFVLGGYYLDDAYLPVHEYFLKKITGEKGGVKIPAIAKMDADSAIENLEKCFSAETDMPLNRLDTGELAASIKEWARSPIDKLYRLGCAYNDKAFIALAEGNGDNAAANAKKSVYFFEAAKSVSDKCKDKRRNTWHISEKAAWSYMHMGKSTKAAKLLENARAGYIKNTYAIALLLTGTKENSAKAKSALEAAAKDSHNLASGLTRLLLAYLSGQKSISSKNMSSKNKRLAAILGLETAKIFNNLQPQN